MGSTFWEADLAFHREQESALKVTELMLLLLVYVYSEYLEVHQTELDKLTTQLKDMKRNSRLVRLIIKIMSRDWGFSY